MAQKVKDSSSRATSLEIFQPEGGSGSSNTGFPTPTGDSKESAGQNTSNESSSRSAPQPGFQLDALSEMLRDRDDEIEMLARKLYDANPVPKPSWDILNPGEQGTRGVWRDHARRILGIPTQRSGSPTETRTDSSSWWAKYLESQHTEDR